MEAAGSSETSESIYQITGLHIPQGFFLMISTAVASNRIADARIEFLARDVFEGSGLLGCYTARWGEWPLAIGITAVPSFSRVRQSKQNTQFFVSQKNTVPTDTCGPHTCNCIALFHTGCFRRNSKYFMMW
jgi:hypothetical protein